MPDPFFPDVSCLQQAKELQTRLAGAEILLFKSALGAPLADITQAEVEAQECDFTGYARETVVAWLDPLLAPGGGAQISAATKQFDSAAPNTTSNLVGGYAILFPAVVGPPALPEQLCVVRQFDTPVTIGPPNTGVQITPTIIIPNGVDE